MKKGSFSRRSFLWMLGAGAASIATAGCSPSTLKLASRSQQDAQEHELIEGVAFVYDTLVTVRACCSQAVLDEALERCQYFESIFSRTIATSDIGRLNAAGGMSVEISDETADLVSRALRYCENSNGAFDISIGAASSLWDFSNAVVPSPESLAEAIQHVDYRKVLVEKNRITLLDPQAKLDLGGIAKGYIAEDLAKLMRAHGCNSAVFDLGGDIRCVGTKPDGSLWQAGVGNPSDMLGDVVATTTCNNEALFTSSTAERSFEMDGKRFWHILDPKTGYPVQTDVLSATVCCGNALDADGITKPLFAMGAQAAVDFLKQQEGVEGLIVTSSQDALASSERFVFS